MSPPGIRVIGGQWKGRRFPVPHLKGLRPTPDRVRETLFNWIQHEIVQAHVLDLYAGTGMIGLEALSRGASLVVSVEKDPLLARRLMEIRKNLGILETKWQVACGDVSDQLSRICRVKRGFDIVCLDPPFESRESWVVLKQLHELALLRGVRWVYWEKSAQAPWADSSMGLSFLEQHFRRIKSTSAGQVEAALWAEQHD